MFLCCSVMLVWAESDMAGLGAGRLSQIGVGLCEQSRKDGAGCGVKGRSDQVDGCARSWRSECVGGWAWHGVESPLGFLP